MDVTDSSVRFLVSVAAEEFRFVTVDMSGSLTGHPPRGGVGSGSFLFL
jgi:hypothetical protein